MVKMNMKTKYRIVTDKYLGYEAQVWRWYWPFWSQMSVNTHKTIEKARGYIDENAVGYKTVVVDYYIPKPKTK
jgi:hypothetical protein